MIGYVAAVVPAIAGYAPGTGLLGSPHDFRNSRYTSAGEDGACDYCHTSHDAVTLIGAAGGLTPKLEALPVAGDFDYLPLWNHDLTANVRYSMYQSGTGAPDHGARASQAAASGTQPGSASLLCLSCHDGSIAVNAYGNGLDAPTQSGTMIDSQYMIGQDGFLGNHHPVGFDYDSVRAQDNEIRPADAATLGAAGTVRMHLAGPGNSMLECSTCHSVHNSGNTGEFLLWRSDVRSQLCLTCHDKGNDPGAAVP